MEVPDRPHRPVGGLLNLITYGESRERAMKMTSPSDELYAILVRKGKAFDEFLSATGLLQHALESDDLAAVNRFIRRREELMLAVDEIDCLINRSAQKVRPDQDQVFSQRMTKMSEALHEKLRRMVSANQKCDAIATSRCEGLKKELAAVYKNEEGLHVYGAKTQGAPKFMDIRT